MDPAERPVTELTPEPKAAEIQVPEGIRQARAAFLRDFRSLLADRRTRGRYVVYRRGERLAVAPDYLAAVAEAVRLDAPEEEYLVLKVAPGADREQQEL